MRPFTYVFVFLFMCNVASSQNYSICEFGERERFDHEPATPEAEAFIDDHIARLMELRRPDWGWSNTPEVVLNLQLTKMTSFFGLNHTLAMMEDEMRSEISNINVGKLALYSMAVRASCLNEHDFGGVNLVQELQVQLAEQWNYEGARNQRNPVDSWYSYGRAVQALCVSGVEINRHLVSRIMRGQNEEDGSFEDSADSTAQVVLALLCVRDQGSALVSRPFFRRKLEETLTDATNFLMRSIAPDGDNIWIANKYASPGGLFALILSEGNLSAGKAAICRMLTHSLATGLREDESAAALAQRIPALRGRSALSLQGGWTCSEPDPVPEGYEPTYDPEPNLDCSTFVPGMFDRFVIYVDVRLSVQNVIGADLGDPFNSTVLVTRVKERNTLLQVMAQAQCDGEFQYETMSSLFGPYLISVGGLRADAAERQYWSLMDVATEMSLQLGVGQFVPTHNQHILFRLRTY